MRINTSKDELNQLVQAARGAKHLDGSPLYPQAQMVKGVTGANGTLNLELDLEGVGPLAVALSLDPTPAG